MSDIGSPVSHALGPRIYQAWLSARCFLKGLAIAWVSTASAAIGFLLFFIAAPAQDILLEVYDGGLLQNLLRWTWFYLVIIVFWALPVFVSARWILARFEDGRSDRPLNSEPVPAWVRSSVPTFLVGVCFAAILCGQLLALRTTPISEEVAQIVKSKEEIAIGRICGASTFKLADCADGARSLSIVVGSRIGGRTALPYLVLACVTMLAVWFYLARHMPPLSHFSFRFVRKAVMTLTTSALVLSCYSLLSVVFRQVTLAEVLQSTLSPASILVVLGIGALAWWGKERLLWWVGIVCGLSSAAAVFLSVYGVLETERRVPFGLVHLLVLPFVTACIAVIALWGLRWQPKGHATHFGKLLLGLWGAKDAPSSELATTRIVNPIFYGLLGITVALNLLFVLIDPLDVTEPWHWGNPWRVNRAMLLPILLGLPVAGLTLLTYGSARLRVPLVLAALVLLGVWNVSRSWILDDYYAIRSVNLSQPRQGLDEAVRHWAEVNDCDLNEQEAAARSGREGPCRAPIIVAAAGGASRAAFHLVGVIGKLIDGERFSPVRGHQGNVYRGTFGGPDGKLILTASSDGTARLWDSRTGAQKAVINRRIKGHTKRVQSAAFSRTGERLVTASWDRTAKIWDLPAVKWVATIEHPSSAKGTTFDINDAAFHPLDDNLLVTVADDGRAIIWDIKLQKPLAELQPEPNQAAHSQLVYGVAFDRDGTRVATASWDRTARIWNVSNLSDIKLEFTLPHKSDVNSAMFSSDGKLVATGSDDGKVHIWDVATGDKKAERVAHTDIVHGVAFDPSGARLVTAGWDKTAKVWDVSNPAEIKGPLVVLEGHEEHVNSAVFSQDGSLILTSSKDRTARVWDAQSGVRKAWAADSSSLPPFAKQLFAISAVSGGAFGAAVTYAALADGQSAKDDNSPPPCNEKALQDRDWFAAKSGIMEPSEDPQASWKACLQLLVSGDFLSPVVVGLTRDPLPLVYDNRATILEKSWEMRYHRHTARDPSKGVEDSTLAKPLAALRHDITRGQGKWLPILLLNGTSVEDGRRIVTSDVDLSLRGDSGIDRVFHDAHDFHALQQTTQKSNYGPVFNVAVRADGAIVLTGSEDKTARLWDAKSGKDLAILVGHTERVHGVGFSPDGKRALTASQDRMVKIWDVANPRTPKVVTTIEHSSSVNAGAFSPDGALLLTGSGDGVARIWTSEGKLLAELLPKHGNIVYSVAFSPDGRHVATASWDRTVKVWDVSNVQNARLTRTLEHGSDVNSVAFSPTDGKLLVTAADDGKARIWNIETSQNPIELLPTHRNYAYGVSFSLDGTRVATASWDRTAKIWDVSDLGKVSLLSTLQHDTDVNSAVFTPDGEIVITGADDGQVRFWNARTGAARSQECKDCDLRLSTAVTMSARFPIVSPAGSFKDRVDREKTRVRHVVDGGYYENFGAATARELMRVLESKYKLEPVVVLVNNEHTVAGLECVAPDRQETEELGSWIWGPVNTVIGTRTARGSHIAVGLCKELKEREGDRFAFVTVASDRKNRHMTLSVNWWMSKNVQRYLDKQLTDDINKEAFKTINRMRQKGKVRSVSQLESAPQPATAK